MGDWFDRILNAGRSIYDTVNPPAGYHVDLVTGRLVPDAERFNSMFLWAALIIIGVLLLTKRH
jgi:hypothetical protein